MNQNILILLLVALGNMQKNHTYMDDKAGEGRILKAGLSGLSHLKTNNIVSQLYETIDALKRVEQISKLADFSTIRKPRIAGEIKEELHDDKDTYIGGIRESFGNIRDFLGSEGKDDVGKAADHPGPPVREPQKNENHGGGMDGLSAIASLLGGGSGSGNAGSGISQEALMSMIGGLMGAMGGNNGGGHNSNASTNSFNGANSNLGDLNKNRNGKSGASNGLDIDKLMKMVNMISALSNSK